jgi:hypothetical protein
LGEPAEGHGATKSGSTDLALSTIYSPKLLRTTNF